MLKKIKALYKRYFPARTKHVWVEVATQHSPEQICAVCGEHEEWDYGCGVAGGMWMQVRAGDKTKHLIPDAVPALAEAA